MARKKDISLKQSFKTGTLMVTGLTVGGMATLAVMETHLGYRFDNSLYWFPLLGSTALIGTGLGLEGTVRFFESIGLIRRVTPSPYPTTPLPGLSSIPGQRGFIVNGRSRSLMMSLAHWAVKGTFGKDVAWFVEEDISKDPDIKSRKERYETFMKPEDIFWPVWVFANKKPVYIEEPFYLSWLTEVWNRQQEPKTQHKALSRNYFTGYKNAGGMGLTWSQYYALVGLCSHSLYGRGLGESGYLGGPPRWIINKTIAHYTPGSPVRF